MLRKSFKPAKCKTALKLASARLKLLKNKKGEQVRQLKREISQLLESGQDQTARIRVEHFVREEKMLTAYVLIGTYCELIVARLAVIESQKNCPNDLKEAVASVIFAAPRCADIPELLDARKNFTAKYGKEFTSAAVDLRPDCGVNRTLVEKLSTSTPDGQTKLKILSEIAKEHNIVWDPKQYEEKNSNPPDDRLRGPNTFAKVTEIPVEPLNVQAPSSHAQTRDPPVRSFEQSPSFSPGTKNLKPMLSTPCGSPQARPLGTGANNSFSSRSQDWDMEFKDATSAAQAAVEAAERASMAARAAAELSRRDTLTRQQSTESHKSSGYGRRDEPETYAAPKLQNHRNSKLKDEQKDRDEDDNPIRVDERIYQESHGPSRSSSSSSSKAPIDDYSKVNSLDKRHSATWLSEEKTVRSMKSQSDEYKVEIAKENIPRDTVQTSSDDDKVHYDSEDSDDGSCQYDIGHGYDEEAAKMYFPSPDRKSPDHLPQMVTEIHLQKRNSLSDSNGYLQSSSDGLDSKDTRPRNNIGMDLYASYQKTPSGVSNNVTRKSSSRAPIEHHSDSDSEGELPRQTLGSKRESYNQMAKEKSSFKSSLKASISNYDEDDSSENDGKQKFERRAQLGTVGERKQNFERRESYNQMTKEKSSFKSSLKASISNYDEDDSSEDERKQKLERRAQLGTEGDRKQNFERRAQLGPEDDRKQKSERRAQLETEYDRKQNFERRAQLGTEDDREQKFERRAQLGIEDERKQKYERRDPQGTEDDRKQKFERRYQLETEDDRKQKSERRAQLGTEDDREQKFERRAQLGTEDDREQKFERRAQQETEYDRKQKFERRAQLGTEDDREQKFERRAQLGIEDERKQKYERRDPQGTEDDRKQKTERRPQLGTGFSRRTNASFPSSKETNSYSEVSTGEERKQSNTLQGTKNPREPEHKRSGSSHGGSSQPSSSTKLANSKTLPESRIMAEDKVKSPAVEQPLKIPCRENSMKRASHVHPKLPDYDTIAAQFQSLRTRKEG